MNNNYFIFFIILILFIYHSYLNISRNEYMVNIPNIDQKIKWYRGDCKNRMSKVYEEFLSKYNLKKGTPNDWMIYFPCNYNNINYEINKIASKNEQQRIFIVNNADQLSSKHNIWTNLVKTYGRNEATKLMPLTYILRNSNDYNRFINEYNKNKIYILKKNIQRQEGLKITNDKKEILNSQFNGFIIAQELLQNPYTIDSRKINMRFYLLFVCQHNEVSAYVHQNGFMYYTKVPFKKGSTDFDTNVTTGYIDRKVYDKNPLTLIEFQKYLDNPNRKKTDYEIEYLVENQSLSSVVFNRIYELLRKLVIAVKPTICTGSHIKNCLTFQLFGADISLSDELFPHIMEVNKGPDLGSKDKKDGDLKFDVVNDMFKVLKISPNKNHKFIKIYDEI